MKIKFIAQDRIHAKGNVLDCGSGVAAEYIRRGVAVELKDEKAPDKKK